MDIEDLLAAISTRLRPVRGPQSLQETVELAVCRRLGAQWVRIQASDTSRAFSPVAPGAAPPLRFPIPTRAGNRTFELLVLTAPGRALDDSERRFLDRIAPVCALAAEVDERCRHLPNDDGRVRDGAAPLVGKSQAMRALRDRIERVASTDFTALIEGESGTGKELVARQVHEISRRRRGPFVAVNCAAIVETLFEAELFGIEDRTATGVRGRRGKFELASEGTLFLDEVADLSLSSQAKLLRAIQDLAVEHVGGQTPLRVDVRIVVATNKRLRDLVREGTFREDLYYRLSGIELFVPPLRTRREDIVELARYFLERHRRFRRLALTAGAADAMTAYDWPGNVRELERTIEAAIALAPGPVLDVDDLPPPFGARYRDVLLPSLENRDSLRAWGRRYVRLVFERCGENKREACRLLDISYHTLRHYLEQPPIRARKGGAADPPPAPVDTCPSGTCEREPVEPAGAGERAAAG